MIRVEDAELGLEVLVRINSDSFVQGRISGLRLSDSGVNTVYGVVELKDGRRIEKPLSQMSMYRNKEGG